MTPRRWSALLPELRAVDAVVVGVLLIMVVLSALAVPSWAGDAGTGDVAAVLVVGAVQTVPVLWRRERPVGALLVFAASAPVGWALAQVLPTWTWAVLVYAVVRRARPLPGALAVVGTTLLVPLLAGLVADPASAVGVGAALEIVLVPVVLGTGAVAVAARARAARDAARRRRAEHDRLAEMLAAQRDRLGEDLRELVAVRVERVVTRTRTLSGAPDPAARLSAVAAEARAALAGMRHALRVLRAPADEPEPAGVRVPVPVVGASPWRPTRDGMVLAGAAVVLVALLALLAAAAAPHLAPGPAADMAALVDVDLARPLGLLPLAVQALALGWWRTAPLPALVAGTAGSCAAAALGATHIVTEAAWGVLVFGAGLGAGTMASGVTVAGCTVVVAVTTVTVGVPDAFAGSRAGMALSYLLVPAIWGIGVLQRRAARVAAEQAASRAGDVVARAVTAQRLGLARELHDVLAHELSALVVTAHAARVAPEPATLAAITEAGERVAGALPTLLEGLGPGVPSGEAAEHLELDAAAVEALVAPVREAGLPVGVDVVGTAPPDRPEADVIAARIVTEALTNTLRHAGPAPTRVTVRHDPDAVEVEVVDDGVRPGHRATREGSGLGIVGMRERAALVGGSVEAGPCGAGWRVAAHLPRSEAGLPLEDGTGDAGRAPDPVRPGV